MCGIAGISLVMVLVVWGENRDGSLTEPEQVQLDQVQQEETTSISMMQEAEQIEPGNLEASEACVYNLTREKILYEKGLENSIAPASTTKLLTALTVLDYCEGQEVVTVGDELNWVAEDASRAGLVQGNTLTIEQLLEALLLPSGNDAAYVLATYTGRQLAKEQSIDVADAVMYFMEAMNEKAVSIGAENSNFVRPDGYDEENQYTTAGDLTQIAAAFWNCDKEDGILRRIAGEASARAVFEDGTDVTWQNTNLLLQEDSPYYYPNAVGLKTGSSGNAGKCLIAAAEISGEVYLTVMMGNSEEGRFQDTLQVYREIETLP